MTANPPTNLIAPSIDEVIRSLDRIIIWSSTNGSRLGYFAALYRKVTIAVRDGISQGQFEDGPRMERLDVIFANRYLEAFTQQQAGQTTTRSWALAFAAAQKWQPLVLQHLLVGMNAHINLDLGIAAAATVGGEPLVGLKNDFFQINDILMALVNESQEELAQVWLGLTWLDRLAGDKDEGLARLGMAVTRNHAWETAQELVGLSNEAQVVYIGALDKRVSVMGRGILAPGLVTRATLLLIRARERGSVAEIIEILS